MESRREDNPWKQKSRIELIAFSDIVRICSFKLKLRIGLSHYCRFCFRLLQWWELSIQLIECSHFTGI